jgi:hypothetical protein
MQDFLIRADNFRFRLGLLLLAVGSIAAGPVDAPNRKIRLRIEWGCEKPRVCDGHLKISEGRFLQPNSLGVEADAPGTLRSDGNELLLRRVTPRIYDGFDVTVVTKPTAILSFILQSGSNKFQTEDEQNLHSFRKEVRINITDLDEKSQIISLGKENLRLILRRTPGDVLSIQTQREHLIFNPGESVSASVRWNPIRSQQQKSNAVFTWEMTPARSGNVLQSGSQNIQLRENTVAETIELPLEISLPEKTGAYDIRCRLSGDGIGQARSTIQVVVVSKNQHSGFTFAGTELQDALVDSFQPKTVPASRRIEKRRGIKRFRAAIRRIFRFAPRFEDDDASSNSRAAVQWKAFRLRIRQPGVPHRLVLSIPTERKQHVGVSILEPNAAGQLMPVGIDSGLSLNGLSKTTGATVNSQAKRQPVLHEILFWPKVTNPVLMLHDIGTGEPFDVTEVNVYELATSRIDEPKDPLLRETSRRLVGPYMHKPLLPESFGATETLDEAGGRSLDDWVTFLTASQRLCDYLHLMSYNSLMISVLADGSTIYPSRFLQPTPRYDTGIYFSTGQDPLRKDVLELLYRMFDREQLVLIPELQFSTPLPALERQLDEAKQESIGIELIGRHGKSWRQSRGTQRGLAPYYNPLNPNVQKAILDVVQEVVKRYQQHESFQGLAIELSSWGYLQLPGLEWGYDDETIERFEQHTGIQVPNAPGDQKFHKRYDFLTGRARREWIRWRCEELARFHRQLSKVVTDAKPAAKFILANNRILQENNSDEIFFHALKNSQEFSDLLRHKGLDFQRYTGVERLLILRPWMSGNLDQITGFKLEETMNQRFNLQTTFPSRQQGTLFFHPPRECRIAEFDQISPWQPAYTWLATQVSQSGSANRKRYAHALASHDAQMLFDGGWMISLGQEYQTQKYRNLICKLPAIPFHLNQIQKQPAIVRIAHSRNKTWLYVVNEVAGEIDVTLRLSCSEVTRVRILDTNQLVALKKHSDGGCTISMHLDSFDIWASEVIDASTQIQDVQTQLSDSALVKLEKEIQFLDRKIFEVQRMNSALETDLKNPGFELPSNNRNDIPGWNLSVQNASLWTLDKQNPRSGQTSLRLTSDLQEPTALSSTLQLNKNRLLVLSVWLRSNRNDAAMQLILWGTVNGKQQSHSALARVDQQWRRYVFRVRELPAGGIQDAMIRFEVQGLGKIWMDDVEIELQRLSDDDLKQLTKVFAAITLARQEKRYTDCQRLLESYWGRLLFDEPSLQATDRDEKPRKAIGIRRLFRRN